MSKLRTNPAFRWDLVAWGARDSPRRGLCAYCHTKLDPEAAQLALFKRDGSMGEFCDDCVAQMVERINNKKRQ